MTSLRTQSTASPRRDGARASSGRDAFADKQSNIHENRDRWHGGPPTLAYASHDFARRDVKSTASPGTKVRGLERMPPWEGPFADPTRRAAGSTGRGGTATGGTTTMAGAPAACPRDLKRCGRKRCRSSAGATQSLGTELERGPDAEFTGKVWEPACGSGEMVAALQQAGFDV